MSDFLEMLHQIVDLGGPVILILIAVSVYVLAVAIYKFWQFRGAAVGRHLALKEAVQAWDAGDRSRCL